VVTAGNANVTEHADETHHTRARQQYMSSRCRRQQTSRCVLNQTNARSENVMRQRATMPVNHAALAKAGGIVGNRTAGGLMRVPGDNST